MIENKERNKNVLAAFSLRNIYSCCKLLCSLIIGCSIPPRPAGNDQDLDIRAWIDFHILPVAVY